MSVSEGDTIKDTEKRNLAARGKLSGEGADGPITDKEALTMNTETGKDGEELPEAVAVEDGVPDPGPDSEHPASVPTEKFAGMNSLEEVCAVMDQALASVIQKVASIGTEPKVAGQPAGEQTTDNPGDSQVKNSDEVEESDDEPATPPHNTTGGAAAEKKASISEILEVVCPTTKEADGPSPRERANAAIAQQIQPAIVAGIEDARSYADFHKIAMADPAAAEAMMAGAPSMPEGDASMGMGMGGDPSMGMGGEVAPMSGDPAAMGGGGDEIDELLAILEQIAEERGMPLEQLIAELESDGGAGGEPAPAPSPVEEAPAPPESSSDSAGGADSGDGTPPESGEEEKVAGMSKLAALTPELRKKLAAVLVAEVDKTPAEIAQGKC
jgi:hypothetical protein